MNTGPKSEWRSVRIPEAGFPEFRKASLTQNYRADPPINTKQPGNVGLTD